MNHRSCNSAQRNITLIFTTSNILCCTRIRKTCFYHINRTSLRNVTMRMLDGVKYHSTFNSRQSIKFICCHFVYCTNWFCQKQFEKTLAVKLSTISLTNDSFSSLSTFTVSFCLDMMIEIPYATVLNR